MIERKTVKKVLTKYGILTGNRVLYEHTVTQVYELVNKRELILEKLILESLTGLPQLTHRISTEVSNKRKCTIYEVREILHRFYLKGIVNLETRRGYRLWSLKGKLA